LSDRWSGKFLEMDSTMGGGCLDSVLKKGGWKVVNVGGYFFALISREN
jgi:hypothetical protein